jgi:cytochrome c-type biogenesis protein CcmF
LIVLGQASLTLALLFCVASVLFLALGIRWQRTDLLRNGYYAVYAFFLSTLIASAVLLLAFLKQDSRFSYVLEYSDPSLSTFYHIAGFWAGQQGSFLLWLLLIATTVVVIALRDLTRLGRLTGGAVLVMCVLGAVFASLMVFDTGSNPFVRAAAGMQPQGLNPLLLHPAMVLHPPTLFIGYVGLAVPFAFAISTLLLGRADKEWVQLCQKWAVFGWLFLSLGIGLGAWWAYVILSWGGYWGWDPVENTSFVPWLTATALLHVFTLYKGRGLFKRWALGLAAGTFFLTILATWTTRSGIINSVHAFGKRALLVWILSSLLIAIVAVSVGLIAWRWPRFGSRDSVDSLFSREFSYHLTILLLTLFAAAVAAGTIVPPLLLERSVGPSTYNSIAQPLGVVTLALMAVCPLLAWRRTEGALLRKTLILPAATAALSVPLWLALGFQANIWGFLGLVVCGFAFGAVLQFVLRSARQAAGPGGSLWAGLGRAFTGSRTRTAAYVIHMGMVLIVAGLLSSALYKTESSGIVSTGPKQDGGTFTTDDGRYTLAFTGMRTEPGPQQSERTYAVFDVFRAGGSTKVGIVEPHTYNSPDHGDPGAFILGRPLEDVFVVADQGFDSSSKQISLRVIVFPLIRWVWIGSILLCVGAAVSLWPRGRTQEQEARALAAADAGHVADRATA